MEKTGLYAPVISPLGMAFAVGLGLPDHHGFSLIGRVLVIMVLLCFAGAAFRKIRHETEPTADR